MLLLALPEEIATDGRAGRFDLALIRFFDSIGSRLAFIFAFTVVYAYAFAFLKRFFRFACKLDVNRTQRMPLAINQLPQNGVYRLADFDQRLPDDGIRDVWRRG